MGCLSKAARSDGLSVTRRGLHEEIADTKPQSGQFVLETENIIPTGLLFLIAVLQEKKDISVCKYVLWLLLYMYFGILLFYISIALIILNYKK